MATPLRLLPGAFTVERYQRLGELGIFDEDDRVELLDGQIVAMSPIGHAHWMVVFRLTNILARVVSPTIWISSQSSLPLSDHSEPEPDIVVFRTAQGFSGQWLPTAKDVVLVVEVSDTSVQRDRDIKIPQYAREGIPEAWLVDVNTSTVTCYRHPLPHGYAEAVLIGKGEMLRSIQIPRIELNVDEILGH